MINPEFHTFEQLRRETMVHILERNYGCDIIHPSQPIPETALNFSLFRDKDPEELRVAVTPILSFINRPLSLDSFDTDNASRVEWRLTMEKKWGEAFVEVMEGGQLGRRHMSAVITAVECLITPVSEGGIGFSPSHLGVDTDVLSVLVSKLKQRATTVDSSEDNSMQDVMVEEEPYPHLSTIEKLELLSEIRSLARAVLSRFVPSHVLSNMDEMDETVRALARDAFQEREEYLQAAVHNIRGALTTMQGWVGVVSANSLYYDRGVQSALKATLPYIETMTDLLSLVVTPVDKNGKTGILEPIVYGSFVHREQLVRALTSIRRGYANKSRIKRIWDGKKVEEELREKLITFRRNPMQAVAGELEFYRKEMEQVFLQRLKVGSIHDEKSDGTNTRVVKLTAKLLRYLEQTIEESPQLLYLDRLTPNMEQTEIAQRMEEYIEEFQERSDMDGHSIRYIRHLLSSKTDIHMLHNIISNLLSNALKYSYQDKEGDHEFIDVGVSTQDGLVIISVTDHGIGMSERDRANVSRFEPGRRMPDASKHAEGTGYGLYLCRRLAEKLGGRLELTQSQEGKGSTFSVILPI